MSSWRAQILIAGVCLLLGLLLVPQFRSKATRDLGSGQSLTDQASYISSLARANVELQDQLLELRRELADYQRTSGAGTSSLTRLIADIEQLRIANGEVDIQGPGVRVTITGTVDVRHLQDAVNEIRSAGVEGMALNDVRLLTRSAIISDAAGRVVVDNQQISPPYVLTAIGNPDTLEAAAQRKGGLFDLWRATGQLAVTVEKVAAGDPPIKMPKTAVEQQWRYSEPVGQ